MTELHPPVNYADEKYKKFAAYLDEHRANVKKAYLSIRQTLPLHFNIDLNSLDKNIEEHDKSKYSEEEFSQNAEYYYGKKNEQTIQAYNKASYNHKHTNKHHPEFWINKGKIDFMPDEAIIEMVCDWESFSYFEGHISAEEFFEKYGEQFHFNATIKNKINTLLEIIKQRKKDSKSEDPNGPSGGTFGFN